MTIITKIQVQKHSKERYSIFVDKGAGEEYGFSVDENTLIKHELRKGMELDELGLAEILYDEEVRRAYLQAIQYLSRQMRTRHEVIAHLKDKEIGQAIIGEVVGKLDADGYLNDREYALAYVRTQCNVGMKGPILIRRELQEKGVDPAVITHSLHEYPQEKQIRNAVQLCEKKRKSYSRLSFIQQKQKLEEMLMRKGYDRGVISICMEELQEEKDEEQQNEALLHQAGKYHEKYKKYSGWEYEQKMKTALYRKGFSLEEIERFLQDKNIE
ncbi:recombination regulator RecX [Ectobacillus ponti]|uniref:Regulatory protein RecX n=1 Tax=Ectobacillus ponti TaxID=2961894 RepID=A0AA41X8S1_9BACI|nr:recombination regulator RecX [Ectobacillus ponti]MCP8970986.1 recombination regulator RecX [Ectobacillus ponti]